MVYSGDEISKFVNTPFKSPITRAYWCLATWLNTRTISCTCTSEIEKGGKA